MTWARSGGGVDSYHLPEAAQAFGVVEVDGVRGRGTALSLSSGGTRVRVALAWRIRVRQATRSTSSIRGSPVPLEDLGEDRRRRCRR